MQEIRLYVTPFRNLDHYQAAYNLLGREALQKYYKTVGGVSGSQTGRNYANCSPFASTSSCANRDWSSVDGKDWFIYNEAYSEPNGDYTVGCYLQNRRATEQGMEPNDESCDHSTGPFYMCGTDVY